MKGREILLGVSGGIAAYKAAALASALVQQEAHVTVVMTDAARQFVGPVTFEAITGRRVPTGVFDTSANPLGAHIDLATQADLFCVAPATANQLSKAACGVADDLLSTLFLSVSAPILLAPAMNSQMWAKPAVQRNIAQLRDDGFHFVDPEEGWLSCRQRGPGRMASPEKIQQQIANLLAS